MKVKELIELLQNCNPEMIVVIKDWEYGGYNDLDSVALKQLKASDTTLGVGSHLIDRVVLDY